MDETSEGRPQTYLARAGMHADGRLAKQDMERCGWSSRCTYEAEVSMTTYVNVWRYVLVVHHADEFIARLLRVALKVPVLDQPFAHVRFTPRAPDGVLRVYVVVCHQLLKFLALELSVGLDDAVFYEPFLHLGVGPTGIDILLCRREVILVSREIERYSCNL